MAENGCWMKKKVWEADIDTLRYDVEDRLKAGRGTMTATNNQLPAALKELDRVVYVARAGSSSSYWFGDDSEQLAAWSWRTKA